MSEQPFQDEAEMTAEECINQGIQLFEDSKRKEALNYFEKAISLDSQSAIAYSHKGLILLSIGDRQEGLDCLNKGLLLDPYHPNALVDKGILLMDNADDTTELFEQAISQNPSNAGGYVYQALNLFALGRNEEALEYIDKALEIKPNDPIFCAKKSEILNYLKRLDEALEWAKKAISLDPDCSDGYLAKSYVHYDKREKAALRTSLDKAIALNPYNARAYSLKGTYFCNQGQVDAGLESMDKAISLTPKDFRAYRTKGLRLITLERYAEALEVFETAISVRSDQAYLWCKKGEILNKLNRMDEAIESFRKANDLILNHPTSTAMIEPQYIDEIKGTITSALEVYDVSKEVENEMNKLDQKDNLPKEFIQRMKVLNDKKNLATKILLSGYGEKDQMKEERDKYKQELETLKDEFTQQLESIRKKVEAVEGRVGNVELQLEEIRIDLSTKMNDYRKKLNMDLPQFGLDPDQVWTVIQYYNAFVETFSSIYVVSQAVESGQATLCAGGNLLANALSMVASFTPFVGGLLSKGIKGIEVFLETREMKQTSRKLMSLATDTTDLSQMTGGVVYDMMMQNKDKRDQIVNITNEDLKDEPQKLLDKVIFFCQMVAEEKDARLYGELYKSPAAKLGHMDANKLIEFWIKDPLGPTRLGDLSGLSETFKNELNPKYDKNEQL